MTAEIGQFALILALFAALYQGMVPLIGAARGDCALMGAAQRGALAQGLLVALAFALLTVAHATDDFSVRNVAENSHSLKPLVYKLTGVWGNHEGSMLLWALVLAGFGAALSAQGDTTPLKARALAVQGLVAAAFLAFILFTSNPFARLVPAPVDGLDLNPLLQDPGLALHPPFLYLGYVGFSIVFAFAVAGLIEGRIDQAWAKAARPWAMTAWTFLTIGIAIGAWWAYYELGWGGFWAWDPVENASLMPWLAGTALIHSLRVTEVRGGFRAWSALLAILAFSLSLVGTFLVRSGVLTSVHAFAVDPARGVFILAILSVALFALRGPRLGEGGDYAAVSREAGLLLNNVVLVAACATVFIGTFYPLFVEVTSGPKLSVGAPYFNLVFAPFAALALLLMAPAAALSWRRGDFAAARSLWPAALAAGGAAIVALAIATPRALVPILILALAVWAGAGTLVDFARRIRVRDSGVWARLGALPRSAVAMAIAHFGLAVAAIGAVGAGAFKSEAVAYARPGDSVRIGTYAARLESVRASIGPNYESQAASFSILKNNRSVGAAIAERRFYPVRGTTTTEAGIRTTASGDVYLTIGEEREGKGWIVRAFRHPLILWLWIGAAVTALGGAVGAGLFGRRGAAERRMRAVPAPAE
jgi:cytochrome c-type biogenesis protein CcmF